MARTEQDVRTRFLTHVRKTSKCWIWEGAARSGYGLFSWKGKVLSAHRVAYVLWRGPILENDVVHHKCGNRLCVRPAHLQTVDQHSNVAEMLERQSYLRAIKRLEIEVKKLREQLESKR